jgi:hypothetical protein
MPHSEIHSNDEDGSPLWFRLCFRRQQPTFNNNSSLIK